MASVEVIKMSSGCVEHEADWRSLVSIHDGRMVLSEGDGAEHLLVLDRVHPHPVEVVRLHLHVWRPQQDDGLVVQLLGDQVHQLCVGRGLALGLHGVPQQVTRGLALVLLVLFADLKSELFDFFEEVIVVVFVRSLRRVEEDQHQEYSVVFLNGILSKAS